MGAYSTEKFLSERQIKPGLCYITKDDYVKLYLGRTSSGEFVFYQLGRVYTVMEDWYNRGIARETIQAKHLTNMFNEIMMQPVDLKSVLVYKTLPKLATTFNWVDYSKDNYYLKWYNKNQQLNNKLVQIQAEKPSNTEIGYVKVKDLEVGRVYGNQWRNKWIYLGRNSKKEFVWLFVGNEEMLIQKTIEEVNSLITIFTRDMIWTTKNNKKIQRNNEDGLKDVKVDLSRISPQAKMVLSKYGL